MTALDQQPSAGRQAPASRSTAKPGRDKPSPEALARQATAHCRDLLERNEPFHPRFIHVETRTICNARCAFCASAAQLRSRPDMLMPDDLIQKIIDELAAAGYRNRLSFYNNNEPFLDKRVYALVALAREALPGAYLEIKTNARSLTPEGMHRIFNAGLDMLFVNDYRPAAEYAREQHSDHVLELIREYQSCRRYKGRMRSGACDRRVTFTIRNESAVLRTRTGTAPNRDPLGRPLDRPCLRPFEMMTIHPEGHVALCSEDLNFEEPVGNVRSERLLDIWSSERYRRIRSALLQGDRTVLKTCSQCDYHGVSGEASREIDEERRSIARVGK